ncbi:MAG: hypothetical protein U5K69_01060 [Balneolaceae bacterium]|nr:hypothetical protein [Balneolaceae bacterium]
MMAPRTSSIARDLAQQFTNRRHRDKPKHRRFTDDLKDQARRWLTTEKLSPELISGRWGVLGFDGVSHETLYQWIWKAKRTGDPTDKDLYKHPQTRSLVRPNGVTGRTTGAESKGGFVSPSVPMWSNSETAWAISRSI